MRMWRFWITINMHESEVIPQLCLLCSNTPSKENLCIFFFCFHFNEMLIPRTWRAEGLNSYANSPILAPIRSFDLGLLGPKPGWLLFGESPFGWFFVGGCWNLNRKKILNFCAKNKLLWGLLIQAWDVLNFMTIAVAWKVATASS